MKSKLRILFYSRDKKSGQVEKVKEMTILEDYTTAITYVTTILRVKPRFDNGKFAIFQDIPFWSKVAVVLDKTNRQEQLAAYRYAVNSQGFKGGFEDFVSLDPNEREQYELGAAGIPTVQV